MVLPKPSNPKSAPIPPAHPTILVPLVSESFDDDSSASDSDSEDAEPTPELSMGLASNMNVEEMWEDELQEQEQGGVKVRGWSELREQIKEDLQQKGGKTHLSLSQINQLLLIQNFATLRLKGMGRITASLKIAHQWHEDEGVHFA
ncbi:hypothetical protein BDR07DRAFT_1379524 [Suillus spraguei]|nr:hypothetical protein BDR07DRAFT_1379524 [Suillus spraguei]